jgi:hypothetical protein
MTWDEFRMLCGDNYKLFELGLPELNFQSVFVSIPLGSAQNAAESALEIAWSQYKEEEQKVQAKGERQEQGNVKAMAELKTVLLKQARTALLLGGEVSEDVLDVVGELKEIPRQVKEVRYAIVEGKLTSAKVVFKGEKKEGKKEETDAHFPLLNRRNPTFGEYIKSHPNLRVEELVLLSAAAAGYDVRNLTPTAVDFSQDAAAGVVETEKWNQGGIDLNAQKMGLDVEKQGQGVEMNFDPAMIEEFKRGDFTGVEGVILRIVPLKSALPMLGLEDTASSTDKHAAVQANDAWAKVEDEAMTVA